MFKKMRMRAHSRDKSQQTYLFVVAQSRKHIFYQPGHVVDSLDGRFDLLALHLSLVFTALKNVSPSIIIEGDDHNEMFLEELQNHFFKDMDRSLRELGVGDLSVPKKMKGFASAWRGRLMAYSEAIYEKDNKALGEALSRNIDSVEGEEFPAYAFINYCHEAITMLRLQAGDNQEIGSEWPEFKV